MEINGTVYSGKPELGIEEISTTATSMGGGDRPEVPVNPGASDPPVHFATFVVLKVGDVVITSADGGRSGTIEGPAGTEISVYTSDPSRMEVAYVRGLGLIAAQADGSTTYYHYNAHGDVVQTTDTTGAVTHDYLYDAFGVEQNADDADTNPFRYCGEQFDAETGDYYLRARYYSPGVGSFTQEDPAMDGLNWYTYCAGNPVAFVDPSGLQDVLLRYIAEKNGATIEVVQKTKKFLGIPIYYGLDHVVVTIDGKSVEYSGELVNRRMVVDSEQFGEDFGITDTTLLTHQPGDEFRSIDDAAIAWGLTYNAISISEKAEYAGSIYDSNGQYAFSQPNKGTKDESYISLPEDLSTLRAVIHSHGAYDIGYDNENFSETDKTSAKEVKVPMYVSTPGGRLKKYNPNPWMETVNTILDKKLPRDPRSP